MSKVKLITVPGVFIYAKNGDDPMYFKHPITLRTMTDGYTTFSMSDDRSIMFEIRVTDEVKQFLIEMLGGKYGKVDYSIE